jgi:pilus assembly protein CpaF
MLIYMIVGGKGGVGATTIAVELAKRYSAKTQTILVDGDLSGRRAAASLFNCFAELDDARAEQGFGIASISKTLSVLEMAASIHEGFTVKADKVDEFFRSKQAVQAVILDTPQPFAAAVRPFAVRATGFIILVDPTLLGLTGARAMQLELTRFGVPASRMVFAATSPAKIEVKRPQLEAALGATIAVEIPQPSDRRFGRAMEQLLAAIEGLPPSEVMALRPSAATPLGERRLNTNRTGTPQSSGSATSSFDSRTASAPAIPADTRDRLKTDIHKELSRRIDFAAMTAADQLHIDEMKTQIEAAVSELVAKRAEIDSAEEIARLRQEIFDEALGYGPLEDLLRDGAISEIMVCGPDKIYIERGGKIERTQKHFTDEHQLRLVIERMIAPIGRRIDEASPMVDARLPDGSRINATITPVTLDGPTITIRRFGAHRMDVNDLVSHGSLTPPMADFLRASVEARLNIVISGGTGSGKTTLLNVLSRYLPPTERIITIEDSAELYLDQEHVVRMESRSPNVEGHGEIKIRDLVRNALRMRPDRIVVGECRGGEALDMLQAMNTGHDGSLTTIHANTPRDCLSRIETMVLMAGFDIPVRAIREQIVNAIDMIIQVQRMRDGSRKIVSISEVVGLEGDVVTMMDIVRYQQHGMDKDGAAIGAFLFTGVQPQAISRFEEYGVNFDINRLSEMQLAITFAE